MVPESAGCAPARIFISVDLPAPFSPTSACTSPAFTSNDTPSSARTPGNVFTMPDMRSNGAPGAAAVTLALLAGVGLGEGAARNRYLRGRLRAREVVMDRVDRLRADLIGMLDRVAVHRTVRDGRARLGRRVVADHHDLALQARGLDGFGGAERRVVVDAEHAFEIFVRLQDVFHRRGRLRALAPAVDVGDDRHPRAARRERLFEALDAVLHRRHRGLVDDRDGTD